MYQHSLFCVLGDFAVLVKAGMTVKQALTYNMVSAVISFIGMIVGILIGSNESSIVWVLALTAGMFLYISLVDMVSISKPNEISFIKHEINDYWIRLSR